MPFPIDLLSLVIAATAEGPAQPIGLPANLDGWMVMFSSVFTLQLLYRVAVFFAILLVAGIVGRIASRAVAAVLARASRKPGSLQVTFIVTWIRRGVLIFGLIMAIQNAGVEITPLIAGLSIGGIVLGLAVQGTLSNFISGIMLMIYQPFDVNDVIETKGIIGSVFAMTMINTVLNTPDNRQVIIPNNDIWGTTIINITRNPNRRVDLMASVAYGADLDQTIALIRELLANNP
ncbi:MAG: mechanosensitive ion channel, partial [Planctomycetes bacterium]|nr:mechanosensitive ion channel [Planctomycetota bacterium]